MGKEKEKKIRSPLDKLFRNVIQTLQSVLCNERKTRNGDKKMYGYNHKAVSSM